MHLVPILSTLRRHRTAALLIVLEIAFTCAIVCNAIFVIGERLHRMDSESGVAEDELIRIQLTGIGKQVDPESLTQQDLGALTAIPGVKAAAVTNMIPFGDSSWNNSVALTPNDPNSLSVAMYLGSPGLRDTFGARLIAGRDLRRDEFVSLKDMLSDTATISSVVITKGLADRLWPGDSALGKQIYTWGDKTKQTVVGVVDRLARNNDIEAPAHHADCAMFLPLDLPYTMAGNYVVRIDPARRADVLAAIETTLDGVSPSRIILKTQPYSEIRANHFRGDRAMAYLLVGVCIALLIITALGVVGLASFWVQQRTRQIGIRRALGATRRDIVRYFQLENFILATVGIVIGMGLAYGINLWLMSKYQVPRLPAEFLPIGALLLWLLGQVAVLGPALRAATIPPAIATRTV